MSVSAGCGSVGAGRGPIAGDPWASAGVPGAEVRARRRLAGLVWARVEDGVPIGLVLKEGCGPQLAGR